jgi:DNA-binding GntR family transcriptional regulator
MISDDALPQTLSYFIFNKLRWRIITGELAPGQMLREQELETQYGSSRGPIRESLRLLLQTGLVEHQQRRGFRVREYTPKEIENIYQLRATLEGMVVTSLEGLPLGPLVHTLEGRCKIMEAHYERNDIEGYFAENSRFHQCIIDYTENKALAQVLLYVNEISLPPRYKLLSENFPSRRSLTYHEEITAHLAAGDIAAAKAVTIQHIMENLGRVIQTFFRPAAAQ